MHHAVADRPPVCVNISFAIVVLSFQPDKSLLKDPPLPPTPWGSVPPRSPRDGRFGSGLAVLQMADEQPKGGVPDLHRSIERAVERWKQNIDT
ncbi:hypothetical protein ACOMHN_031827 [Nucella lapillus]